MRPCGSFPPSVGSTGMPILRAQGWRSARCVFEWLCTQERWNQEVVIIFGMAARYRRATAGGSHKNRHPENFTLHTGAVCSHSGFKGNLFFVSPRTGHRSHVFEILPASSFISWVCAFCAGGDVSIFSSGPIGFPFGRS